MMNIYFRHVGIKFDSINYHYKPDFVDFGLYILFKQNNFIYPLY